MIGRRTLRRMAPRIALRVPQPHAVYRCNVTRIQDFPVDPLETPAGLMSRSRQLLVEHKDEGSAYGRGEGSARDELLDYMRKMVDSGEWSWAGIDQEALDAFAERYPNDDKLKILVELAEKNPTFADDELEKKGLGKFVPVSSEIVAEARRLLATGAYSDVCWAHSIGGGLGVSDYDILAALEEHGVHMDACRCEFVQELLEGALAEKMDYNERCKILLAPRGIGKSTLMKALVQVLPRARQSIALYVDHRRCHSPILPIVVAKLLAAGVRVQPNWTAVQRMLLDQGITLYVFTDEVEDVLQKKFAVAETVFSDLHTLGTDTDGGWWAMVAGSSGKLVYLRRDLNSRKFQPIHLTLPPPTPEHLEPMYDHFGLPPERRMEAFFFTGGHYANLDRYSKKEWKPVPPRLPFGGTEQMRINTVAVQLCRELLYQITQHVEKEKEVSPAQQESMHRIKEGLEIHPGTRLTDVQLLSVVQADPTVWRDVELTATTIEKILTDCEGTWDDVYNIMEEGILRGETAFGTSTVKVNVPAWCVYYGQGYSGKVMHVAKDIRRALKTYGPAAAPVVTKVAEILLTG